MMEFVDKPYLRWFTLFVTSGTLVCCALPVLLVSVGLGAVVASLNYSIPGLMFLAEHNFWIFRGRMVRQAYHERDW